MADILTLESLGVNLAELSARIATAQEAAARDDDACARIAGVTVERWLSWKGNRVPPGVARMPKLAEAVASTVPFLMFGIGQDTAAARGDALDFARLSARLVNEITPHVDALVQLGAELEDTGAAVVDGAAIAALLYDVAHTLEQHTPGPIVKDAPMLALAEAGRK